MLIKERNIFFYTGTIQNWQPVFLDFPETISIILDAMTYLVKSHDVKIYAFVIMKDHVHIIWEFDSLSMIGNYLTNFRRYVAKEIVKFISEIDSSYLEHFHAERLDRKHKIWKINPDNFHLTHKTIVIQKINYVNENPTKGDYKVVDLSENYLFSSAKAYLENKSNFNFLTLFEG